MRYKYLFLDLDNTIFDFSASSKLAFSDMLFQYDIQEEADMYDLYRRINADVWKELEQGKIDQEELRDKRFRLFFQSVDIDKNGYDANAKYLENLIHRSSLIGGAQKFMTLIQERLNMVAVTNGLKEVQRPRIMHTQIDQFFDYIIVSDEIGHAKPSEHFFEIAYEPISHKIDKSDILMIGDSLVSDIQGGNNFGLDTCWFNPKNMNNLSEHQPDHVAHSFQQIIDIIKS